MSDRPVRVILDASAIVAFTRGSIDVGETIAEVSDEQGAAGLPVLCLVQAAQALADRDRLDVRIHHEATVLLDNLADDWEALTALYDAVGRLDAATAVIAAYDSDSLILTAQPRLYGGLQDGGPIIPLPPS